jgi:hypothetical protein
LVIASNPFGFGALNRHCLPAFEAALPAADFQPKRLTMFFLIGATMAGSIVLAAASPVPKFNVEPGCRAAASQANTPNYIAVCRDSEQKAREQLAKQWGQWSASDKSECVPLSSLGGGPTYTELITCLEMTRDARLMRQKSGSAMAAGDRK